MAILVDASTRAICQGMTGKQASFHCERAISYGTQIVAGVTPGKGGHQHLGLPVFDNVAEAVSETGANASVIYVPPANAAAAILESVEAKIPLIVCVSERVPVLDIVRVKQALAAAGSVSTLIGPNSIGVITPDACRLGVMSGAIFQRGRIGIVSRPGTLTYEAVAQTSAAGLGQSTCVSIGADPIHGLSFADALRLFNDDDETDAVVLIGEIGGSEEEQAAELLASGGFTKPLIAYIAGRHAPPGRRMGHAGAVIGGGRGDAADKQQALRDAGAHIVDSATAIGDAVGKILLSAT